MTTSLSVFPAYRHARLTEAHAAVLFGGKKLVALHKLSDGSVCSDGVVDVKGDRGAVVVRVVFPAPSAPWVAASCVYVTSADADVCGFVGLSTSLSRAPGCVLSGPVGSVVLQNGVLAAERVTLPAASAASPRVDVQIEGERPRLLRGVHVERGDVAAVYVVDVSGELRPGTPASVL